MDDIKKKGTDALSAWAGDANSLYVYKDGWRRARSYEELRAEKFKREFPNDPCHGMYGTKR